MLTTYYIILAVSTLLFALIGVWGMQMVLTKMNLVDAPSERSNHAEPVPTGAGLGFIVIVIGFLTVANAPLNVIFASLLLCIVSFIDDMRSLPIAKRLGAQLIAVIMCLNMLGGPVFQGLLPEWADYAITGLIWLWFINLYNFMDGIDGITITESIGIALGVALFGMFVEGVPHRVGLEAWIIFAGVIAFIPWNLHPARLFMGDTGSVTLGFLFGFLLFQLAASGQWAAALILPAYYMLDATITLLKRIIAGKAFWQAHSEHYYQKAVRAGRRHDEVTMPILWLNFMLIVLALISAELEGLMLLVPIGLAYVAAFVLLLRFGQSPRKGSHEIAHTA